MCMYAVRGPGLGLSKHLINVYMVYGIVILDKKLRPLTEVAVVNGASGNRTFSTISQLLAPLRKEILGVMDIGQQRCAEKFTDVER